MKVSTANCLEVVLFVFFSLAIGILDKKNSETVCCLKASLFLLLLANSFSCGLSVLMSSN
jgi:hypothetical protein